jgi:photosystem II stability/assembly factor-like uncharacterized protein
MKRILLLLQFALAGATAASAQDTIPVAAFAGQTHVHGLAVDAADPGFLFIATHHGLYRAGSDGIATRVSVVQDFMGFSPSPVDGRTMFASGHPAAGGNLGLIVSSDGGRTWAQRSPGLQGPADFHMLAVSRADPNVIYGVFGGLQRSNDAGVTWAMAGQVPPRTVDIAASAVDPNRIYAAAVGGLFVSTDAGATWAPLVEGAPVSLVELGPGGELFAFALGRGLLVAPTEREPMQAIATDLGELYLTHLAPDPTRSDLLFAADQFNEVLMSEDGGRSWRRFGT